MSKQSGYVALTTILVILAIVVAIGTSVSLLSVSEAQLSLAQAQSNQAFNILDACVAEALYQINEEDSLPSIITLPEGQCNATIDLRTAKNATQEDDGWLFTLSTLIDGYEKIIQVDASRGATVRVNQWKEVE